MPDFTNCKRLLGNAYAGANGKKIAIEYQGEQYMLKFPPSGQTKHTELSYTNSCLSEHIASTIFNMVGIYAQKTILGTYLKARYGLIISPAYDIALHQKNSIGFSM